MKVTITPDEIRIDLRKRKRRKPTRKAGDKKTLKDGTVMICRESYVKVFGVWGVECRRGKPVLEWVKEGTKRPWEVKA